MCVVSVTMPDSQGPRHAVSAVGIAMTLTGGIIGGLCFYDLAVSMMAPSFARQGSSIVGSAFNVLNFAANLSFPAILRGFPTTLGGVAFAFGMFAAVGAASLAFIRANIGPPPPSAAADDDGEAGDDKMASLLAAAGPDVELAVKEPLPLSAA